MPKLLFLVPLLEGGLYRCHAGVRCASEKELQQLLQRQEAANDLGWQVDISCGPWFGYDGKPTHEAVLWLSKPLSSLPPVVSASEPAVQDSVVDWPLGVATEQEPPAQGGKDALSWQQRMTLQKESKQLLRQIGITELGIWK